MAENKNRKPNRTKEQIIAEFDSKIAYHEKCIESLKAKKGSPQSSGYSQAAVEGCFG